MKANAGLWIDHREAVIVVLSENGETTTRIKSAAEDSHAGQAANGQVPSDDLRDRAFSAHLTRYYDDVIAHLRDAGAIFIIGPGEAKGELKKRFGVHKGDTRLISVETADNMTQPQVVAHIRGHYHAGAKRGV